jgi:hypothetical protein
MLSAFSVKTWPGLAPREYSIDTTRYCRSHELGLIYLGELRRSESWRTTPGGSSCGHPRMVVWNEEGQESRPVFLGCSRDVVLGVRLE